MEPVGAFLGEEWESLSRMFFSEEADFMAHLNCQDEHDNSFNFGTSSTFDEANMNMGGVVVDESLFHSSDTFSTNILHYFSQESSNSSGSNYSAFFPTPSHENHFFSDSNHIQERNNTIESIDFSSMEYANNLSVPIFPDNLMEEIVCMKEEIKGDKLGNADSQPTTIALPGEELQLKRKPDMPEAEETNDDLSETPKKKPRVVSRHAQKGKRNATSKKNQKLTLNGNGDEETDAGINGQTSSCCSSEDDSNASQDLNGRTTLNSSGKTRASRGAATDPQSLYARRRRERINERLRILQTLVPNGTKVDISTMLEEAVHYVKFLQVQIKLLSSDDLWMYAPIAYNGMDIGLCHKISPTL